MHLYDIPMVFILIGLALYAVLAGADFGAGIWQLLAGSGEHGDPHPRSRPPFDGARSGRQTTSG